MKEFKLLDSPNQSSYFSDILADKETGEKIYEYGQDVFNSYNKSKFLQEVLNQSVVKKQAGYSKTRNCNFISLILIAHNTGDGDFTGYSIEKTHIINNNNNKIEDGYQLTEESGEVGLTYETAYHVLQNGKLMEFKITQGYEKELKSIYEIVSNTRLYYDFENKFPAKSTNEQKKNKI